MYKDLQDTYKNLVDTFLTRASCLRSSQPLSLKDVVLSQTSLSLEAEIREAMVRRRDCKEHPSVLPCIQKHGAAGIRAVVAALKNENPMVREEAANALGELGEESFIDPLLEAVQRDATPGPRTEAIEALGRLKAKGPAVLSTLKEASLSEFWKVRSAAIKALGRLGPEAHPAIPVLLALLKDDQDLYVKACAAEALENIGPAGKAALQSKK